jgi:protease-4
MRVPGLARRLVANANRGVRVGIARSVLPRGRFWLSLRLAPPLDELRAPSLPWSREAPLTLLEVLRTLARASEDPRVAGVVVRLAGAPRGLARATAVRRALERLRAAGKPVAAYGERLGIEEYSIASAATRFWLPEAGSLHLLGLRAEGFYLRGLMGRLAVEPDLVRVGSHKTAGESFTRDSMSSEQREQLGALLDDLYGELVAAIASGRALPREAVRERIDRGPYTARAAVEAGLADGCLFPDELETALESLGCESGAEASGPRRVRLVHAPLYHALCAADPGWRPLLHELPRIAYVVASGVIHRGPGFVGISVEGMRELLERLRKDSNVRGIVLRLASPGGEALASDLLWRALRIARREKPVVVSMGEVAASGGYFAASAADAVLAEAGTVTGSIGVVGGKLNLEGLYRRLGISRDGVERGRRAGLLSESRGFTPEERVALRDDMRSFYELFLDRVAEGRGMSRAGVERVAQGRIWSGLRAQSLGLVDALGGPLEALGEVRRRAGIQADERVIVEVHPRRRASEGLRRLIGLGLQLR